MAPKATPYFRRWRASLVEILHLGVIFGALQHAERSIS